MINTDRSIINLNYFHPSSSLIFRNPSQNLAVIFEIRIDHKANHQFQISDKYGLKIQHFDIQPIRGIILPQDTQLVKIYAKTSRVSKGDNSISKGTMPKKQPKIKTFQQEVGDVQIKCSYMLEYNKQVIHKQTKRNSLGQLISIGERNSIGGSLFGESLQKMQKQHLKVYVYSDSARQKPHKHNQVFVGSKSDQKAQKIDSRRSIEQFSKKLKPININTIKSTNYIKEYKDLHELIDFENQKLNQDFDLIRNKLTLEDVEMRRSNQLFRQLQIQNHHSHPFKDNKIDSAHTKKGLNFKPQDYDHNSDPSHEPYLKKNQTIDESFVVQSFRHTSSKFKQPLVRNKYPGHNQSLELIILAFIAAVFFSLGSNVKPVFLN